MARPIVLATSRLPAELAVAVPVPGNGLRILIGMVMAESPDRRRCVREVERVFRTVAARPGVALSDVVAALEPVTRWYAPGGYISATLVHVSPAGATHVLRCGGPQILAISATTAGPDPMTYTVIDPGPGGPPLGLGAIRATACAVPDDARIVVLTTEYAFAHFHDYHDSVQQAVQVRNADLAAVQLLIGPATTTAGTSLAGPILILDPVT
ncbi:hypothetical protein ACIBSW_25030 [Actinoplanes sp. NPDC049668]|uniref:hypothetical protein n=1 Tax=unclassified Actinoplanes TaxID=2626549 RepID=UPI0033BCFCA9